MTCDAAFETHHVIAKRAVEDDAILEPNDAEGFSILQWACRSTLKINMVERDLAAVQ